MVVLFAAQVVPQAFHALGESITMEIGTDAKGSSKVEKEETSEKFHPAFPSIHLLITIGHVQPALHSGSLPPSVRDVLTPPPDAC